VPESTRTRPAHGLVTGGTLRAPDGTLVHIGPDAITVGRGELCQLRLQDPLVSTTHCELLPSPQGVVLRDLDSTNGTRVAGIVVREACLQQRCVLRVGDTDLVFEPDDTPQLVTGHAESFGPLVGGAPAMRRLYDVLEAVAGTELHVLITAETGSGKELVAQALHQASPRKQGPFVVVDCGALPGSLAESILFGHEKGSFTGAIQRRPGAFREAHGGTVFLDELGELPEEVQPKLLRVIAERSVKRVGATEYEPVDVRIIAATRRDLRREMNARRFREDLYFRLAQVRLELPPLRERLSDVPLLVAQACPRVGRPDTTRHVLGHIDARFRNYDWPGNVRELMNVASVLASIGPDRNQAVLEDVLPLERWGHTPAVDARQFVEAKRVFEEQYFRSLLDATEGNISEIARRCGLARHQVRAHLRKLGLL
jgi:DNA-binding NtrC family response regulator